MIQPYKDIGIGDRVSVTMRNGVVLLGTVTAITEDAAALSQDVYTIRISVGSSIRADADQVEVIK